MTPAAGYRIHSAIDSVPGKVVTAMRCAAMGPYGIPAGRLEFDANPMAGVAVTRLVAHVADIPTLITRQSMVIRKKWRVHKSSKREIFIGFIVAFQAKSQVLPIFLNMPDGYGWTLFSGACQ